MSEQEQISQLSALFDGELSSGQAEMVIRRALRDSSMRDNWERYALIGACMRNEPFRVSADHANLADRVRARLAAEPELSIAGGNDAPARSPVAADARSWLLGRGAVGGAIAASVALVSIMILRSVPPDAGTAGADSAQVILAASQADADSSAMPSYTTPVDSAAGMQRVPAPLFKYVVAHSEVASSMLRSSYDLGQDAEEMTEAEIKDYR
jgi:negative regulator of sigma E activity